MRKTKLMKKSTPGYAHGGSKKMFGKQSVGKQKADRTSQEGSGGGKWASGGSGKMFGKQSASPSKAC